MSSTPAYISWLGMRQRCYYNKHNRYEHYGGRGIKVCDEWVDSFENFHKDMGDKPEGYSIDRVDNDGDYTPKNCKWSSVKEQNNNRGGKHNLTGVRRRKDRDTWVVAFKEEGHIRSKGCFKDFFEACCVAKSYLNKRKQLCH